MAFTIPNTPSGSGRFTGFFSLSKRRNNLPRVFNMGKTYIMSKTDPKDDDKKIEFFAMLDEYFETKQAKFQEEKKNKKTEAGDLFVWLFGG